MKKRLSRNADKMFLDLEEIPRPNLSPRCKDAGVQSLRFQGFHVEEADALRVRPRPASGPTGARSPTPAATGVTHVEHPTTARLSN